MTLDEARKIGRIIGTADSGCKRCVEDLVCRLNVAFPSFRWAAGEYARERISVSVVEVGPSS